MPEGISNTEDEEDLEREKKVASAHSFRKLYEILEELGGLKGSLGFYTAATLKEHIEKFLAGKLDPMKITNAAGLRDKVLILRDKLKKPPGLQFENVKILGQKGEIESGWNVIGKIPEGIIVTSSEDLGIKKIIPVEQFERLNPQIKVTYIK